MLHQPRILAVDDTATNLRIIGRALEGHAELEYAASGEEALATAATFRPDIILLDIVMGGIDGYETCRRIRANADLQQIKVIMVSSQASVTDRLQAYQVGADDYLIKPFDPEELRAKIRVYLRLRSVEEVDRLKTNLITLLSHEVRTPLTTMMGPAKMLLDEHLTDAERRQLAQMVYVGAGRLHTLIEKVQLLGTLWSGVWRPDLQRTPFSGVLRPALDRIRTRAEELGIAIDVTCECDAEVEIDPHAIDRVIASVLDNALRHSPPGGRISVRLHEQAGLVELSITDQGRGIAPDFQPLVFEAFAKDDIHHHNEGHGLSMAIARQILLHHGGTIEVDSRPGETTTFHILLPPPHDRAAA